MRTIEPCMCGAPDCPRCYPGSWREYGSEDWSEEEIESLRDREAERRAEARWDEETGRDAA